MVNDPIADMFTRIRNALMITSAQVAMPSAKMKVRIAEILLREGYIEGFSVSEEAKPTLTIDLKYFGQRRDRRAVITTIERVSTPGRRVYVGKSEIPWVMSGMGIAIISTNKGLLTDQEARRAGAGGEIVGYIS
jgi:small subunit ribosomal protein S8